MVLADSGYPFLSVMWSMFIFFGWILFIWLLVTVYTDLFRRDDISGWGKAAWVIFTVLLPFIGVFVYLIAQGRKMGERNLERARAQQQGMDEYIRSVSATSHTDGAAEIAKAKQLLDQGAISRDEYEVMKHKALAG